MAENLKSKGSLERILMLGSGNAEQDKVFMEQLLFGLTPFFEHRGKGWMSAFVEYCTTPSHLKEQLAHLRLEAIDAQADGLSTMVAAVLPLVLGDTDGMALYEDSGLKEDRATAMLVGNEADITDAGRLTLLQSYLIAPQSERLVMISPNHGKAGFVLGRSGRFPSALPKIKEKYGRSAFIGGPDASSVANVMELLESDGLLPDCRISGTFAKTGEKMDNAFDRLKAYAADEKIRQAYVETARNVFGGFDRAIFVLPQSGADSREYFESLGPVLGMIAASCKDGVKIDFVPTGKPFNDDVVSILESSNRAEIYGSSVGLISSLSAEADAIKRSSWASMTAVLPGLYYGLRDPLHFANNNLLTAGGAGGALVPRPPADVAVNGSKPAAPAAVVVDGSKPESPVAEPERLVVLPGEEQRRKQDTALFGIVDPARQMRPAVPGSSGLVDGRGNPYNPEVVRTADDVRDGPTGRVDTSGEFTDDELKGAVDDPLDNGTAVPGRFKTVPPRQEELDKAEEARRAAAAAAKARQTISPPGSVPVGGEDSTVLNIAPTKTRGSPADHATTGAPHVPPTVTAPTAVASPGAKAAPSGTKVGRPQGPPTVKQGAGFAPQPGDGGIAGAVIEATRQRDDEVTQPFKTDDLFELAGQSRRVDKPEGAGRQEVSPPPVPLTQVKTGAAPPIPPYHKPAGGKAVPPPSPFERGVAGVKAPPVQRPRPATGDVPPAQRPRPPTGPQGAVPNSPPPRSPVSPFPAAQSPLPVQQDTGEADFDKVAAGLQAEQKAMSNLEKMLAGNSGVSSAPPDVLENYRKAYRALLEKFPSGGPRVALCGSMMNALERVVDGPRLDDYFEIVSVMSNKSPVFPDLGATNTILGETLRNLMSQSPAIPYSKDELFELLKLGVVNFNAGGDRIYNQGLSYISRVDTNRFKAEAVKMMHSIAKVDVPGAAEKLQVFFDKLGEFSSEESKELYVSGVGYFGAKARWKDKLPEIADLLASKYKSLTSESMPDELDAYRRLKGRYDDPARESIVRAVAIALASLNALEMKEFFALANDIYSGQSGPPSADTANRTIEFVLAVPGYQKGQAGLAYKEIADVVKLAAKKCDVGGKALVDKGVPVLKAQPEEYRAQVREMLMSIGASDPVRAADKTSEITGIVADRNDIDKSMYLEGITLCCEHDGRKWAGAVDIAKEVLDKLEIVAGQDLSMYRKLLAKYDGETRHGVWSAVDEAVKAVNRSPEGKANVSELFGILSILSGDGKDLPPAEHVTGMIRSDLPGMITSGYYEDIKETIQLSLENFERGGSSVFQILTAKVNQYGPTVRPVLSTVIEKVAKKAFESAEAKPGEKAVAIITEISDLALGMDEADNSTKILYFKNVGASVNGGSIDDIHAFAKTESEKRRIVSAADQQVADKVIEKYSSLPADGKKVDNAFYAGMKSLAREKGSPRPSAEADMKRYVSVVRSADLVVVPDVGQMCELLEKSLPDLIKRQGDGFNSSMGSIVSRCIGSYNLGGKEMIEAVESLPASYDGKYRDDILVIMDNATKDGVSKRSRDQLKEVVALADYLSAENRAQYFKKVISVCNSKEFGWKLLGSTAQQVSEEFIAKQEAELVADPSAALDTTSDAERQFIEGGKKMEADAANAEKDLESNAKGKPWMKYGIITALVVGAGLVAWKLLPGTDDLEKRVGDSAGTVASSAAKSPGPDSRVYHDTGARAVAPASAPVVASSRPDSGAGYDATGAVAAAKPDAYVGKPAEKPASQPAVAGKGSGAKGASATAGKGAKQGVTPAKTGSGSYRVVRRKAGPSGRGSSDYSHMAPYVGGGVFYDPKTGAEIRMGPATPAEQLTPPYGGRAINTDRGAGSWQRVDRRYSPQGSLQHVDPQVRRMPGRGYRGSGLR